jgi:hypothetical protein
LEIDRFVLCCLLAIRYKSNHPYAIEWIDQKRCTLVFTGSLFLLGCVPNWGAIVDKSGGEKGISEGYPNGLTELDLIL